MGEAPHRPKLARAPVGSRARRVPWAADSRFARHLGRLVAKLAPPTARPELARARRPGRLQPRWNANRLRRADRSECTGVIETAPGTALGHFSAHWLAEPLSGLVSQLVQRRAPVAQLEHGCRGWVEVVSLVALQVVDQRLIGQMLDHQPVRACRRYNRVA